MSEFKLSATIGVTKNIARSIIKKFFSKIPKVKTLLTLTGELAKERGYIATPRPLRRVRWFGEWQEKYSDYANNHLDKEDFKILGSIERRGKNTPIQGTNANVIKLALVKLQEEIDNNNWPVHILLTVHDEILAEAREDIAEEWSKVHERIMLESAKVVLNNVTIQADPVVGDYWTK